MFRIFIQSHPFLLSRGLVLGILILCLVLASNLSMRACDVCGGNTGSTNLGFVSGHQRSFVGFRTTFRSYSSSDHIHNNELDKGSTEKFWTTDLMAKIHIHKRLQLIAFLPYQVNRRTQDDASIHLQGLGDATCIANSILLHTANPESKWTHLLQGGLGLKMPTGKWDALYNGNFVHYNMQLGTGSWDLMGLATYSISNELFSTIAEVNYKYNTPNKLDYRFGDRLNVNLTSFYTLKHKEFKFIPSLGLQYEYANPDFRSAIQEEMTGGFSLKSIAGLQSIRYPFNMGISGGMPLISQFSEGHVKPNLLITCQLIYFFSIKK